MVCIAYATGWKAQAAFGSAPPAGARPAPVAAGGPVVIPHAEQFDIRAKSGADYRIFVAGPTGPAPPSGFPIIYFTDGNANFPVVLAAVRKQSREATPAIVVGIGYPGDDASLQRDLRAFDLTPPTSADWMKAEAKGMESFRTGGNGRFLEFIETELKPVIEGRYKVDRSRQTLFGHSFGGLFVLNVLFSRPEAFQTYVAASPSLWWNAGSILADAERFLKTHAAGEIAARVMVCVGEWDEKAPPGESKERTRMLLPRRKPGAAKDLVTRLNAARIRGLIAEFREFAEEDHGSAVLPAASRGVRFALEGRRPTPPAAGPPPPPATPSAVRPRTLRLPETPYSYGRDELPPHFRTPAARAFDNTPATNPITDWGATLGRVLFYDTRLSSNGSISCASCHQQKHAFADPRRFLTGHEGASTDRNGMSLVNLRFTKPGFFWDIRAATLEEQVLTPIRSEVEMGQTPEKLVRDLRRDEHYPELFRKAFADPEITSDRIAKALAQFLRSMVSYRSKYDAGLAAVDEIAEDFPNFTAEENLGKTLFGEKCAICHTEGRGSQSAYFSMFTALNNGIDRTGSEPDVGRGDMTLIPSDVGLFKPSDLRNIEYTAPYMHDGRFQILEEVIEHYSGGVNRHPNVSGFIFRMHFSVREKRALVAFLRTLSDEEFLKDPRFSDPWRAESDPSEAPGHTTPSPGIPAPAESPPAPLTSDERARRLARREGLPLGEALRWLRSLDADGDGTLSRDETAPLAKLLRSNGSPPRFDRRRFAAGSLRIGRGGDSPPALMVFDKDKDGRLGRSELPESRRHLIDAGDTDDDDMLNLDEARKVEAVERFIALQTNDRDRLRVERLVQSLKLPEAQAKALDEALRQAKADHDRRMKSQDAELVATLDAVMGANAYARFQHLMLMKQDARELTREGGATALESLQERIFEFDKDRDGRLSPGDLETLAAVLDETPGGFGTALGPLPTVTQFAERMMARDRDRDGSIAARELPERMLPVLMPANADGDGALSRQELDRHLRNTGFESLVAEGIYAGGGFVNAFSNSSRLLMDLNLPPSVRRDAQVLLDGHERTIQDAITNAVVSACRMLREAQADRSNAAPDITPGSIPKIRP
jgi:cytochrome c peroxidase/predicted alpha/beta superfamily hydrolase/Ca2+-binding EF-hand superfamily protein